MMRKLMFNLFLATVMCLLVAPIVTAKDLVFTTTTSGGTAATLSFAKPHLISMIPAPFRLAFSESVQEATYVQVKCDLTMPAMPMPPNRPQIRYKDGAYSGEAIFTMAGAWQACFTFTRVDGSKETAIFDIPAVGLR